MGRFMIPCCCICGASPRSWHNAEWESLGDMQDFCPSHALPGLIEFIVPHMEKDEMPDKQQFSLEASLREVINQRWL